MTPEVVTEGGPILRLAIVELELALVVVLLSAWTHNLLDGTELSAIDLNVFWPLFGFTGSHFALLSLILLY